MSYDIQLKVKELPNLKTKKKTIDKHRRFLWLGGV